MARIFIFIIYKNIKNDLNTYQQHNCFSNLQSNRDRILPTHNNQLPIGKTQTTLLVPNFTPYIKIQLLGEKTFKIKGWAKIAFQTSYWKGSLSWFRFCCCDEDALTIGSSGSQKLSWFANNCVTVRQCGDVRAGASDVQSVTATLKSRGK